MEPCLADAAPEAAPGLPFVESRYAEARPDAAAIIAAKLQGGSMLNLLSENCAGLLRIGALHQGSSERLCLLGDGVKQKRRNKNDLAGTGLGTQRQASEWTFSKAARHVILWYPCGGCGAISSGRLTCMP